MHRRLQKQDTSNLPQFAKCPLANAVCEKQGCCAFLGGNAWLTSCVTVLTGGAKGPVVPNQIDSLPTILMGSMWTPVPTNLLC